MASISEIQTCINNLTTASADELLLLAARTNKLTTNRVVKVATVDDLPDLNTCSIASGTVVFVESIQVPVIANVGCWSGLDNREVRNDRNIGLIWSWGSNASGILGDNTTISKSSPVSVVGGFNDWCQISAGSSNLAIKINGTAWSWGANYIGNLGDGTTISKSSPVSVVGGFTWCQVSAGVHSLGITTNGTAWAWGRNNLGQLGDGTTVNNSSPVSVVGGFTDWCQVSAGNQHSLGIRSNGTAWAWGCNGQGRLGDGTTVAKSSPVSVLGGFTDWCQVSAGVRHSLGVKTNGSAWAWGNNICGQLGDGTVVDKSSPISVVGGFTDWCQVSISYQHSLALRSNGTAWSWGFNNSGRLGDGTTVNKSSPVSVVGGFTDWLQIEAGENHSIGLRTNGTAWTWGCNGLGRLGDGTTVNKSSPVSVVGGFTDWCQVSAGDIHMLGIRNI